MSYLIQPKVLFQSNEINLELILHACVVEPSSGTRTERRNRKLIILFRLPKMAFYEAGVNSMLTGFCFIGHHTTDENDIGL